MCFSSCLCLVVVILHLMAESASKSIFAGSRLEDIQVQMA